MENKVLEQCKLWELTVARSDNNPTHVNKFHCKKCYLILRPNKEKNLYKCKNCKIIYKG
jgi:hypothetical protein